MIQCPLCQMINEDQTRFCAECGARLGPQPGPQAGPQAGPPMNPQQQQMPPQQAMQQQHAMPPQQQMPQQGMHPQQQHMPQQQQMPPQPQMPQQQAMPPQPQRPAPGPRLNSPMLRDAEGPSGGFGQSPDEGGGEMDRLKRMRSDKPQQHHDEPPAGKPVKKLRSPLLAAEEDDYEDEYPPQAPQGRGGALRSPMLGGGGGSQQQNYPQDHHQQGTGGRHHLHSPLLGDVDEDDDYYEDRPGPKGLHSPILGGGGGGSPKGGGLRSPILGGASQGSGGFEDYYEDEDYDPYADEGNPNVLRSPLLSSKIHEQPVSRPQPPAAQQQSTYQPGNMVPPAKPQGFQPHQAQDPRAWEQPGPAPGPAPAQMAPGPGSAPAAFVAPAPQQPNDAPAFSSPASAPKGPGGGPEEFPDMTQFRRRGESTFTEPSGQPAAVPPTTISAQAPISQFSASLDAGFIPPAPSEMPMTPSAPPAAPAPGPASPASDVPSRAPRGVDSYEKASEPAKAPVKRSSSKLLGDSGDMEDDDYGYQPSRAGATHSSHSSYAPQAPASPLPKLMGGVAVMMGLLKAPLLLQFLPAISNPQYTWQTVDIAATMVGLIALGLGLILSKS